MSTNLSACHTDEGGEGGGGGGGAVSDAMKSVQELTGGTEKVSLTLSRLGIESRVFRLDVRCFTDERRPDPQVLIIIIIIIIIVKT